MIRQVPNDMVHPTLRRTVAREGLYDSDRRSERVPGLGSRTRTIVRRVGSPGGRRGVDVLAQALGGARAVQKVGLCAANWSFRNCLMFERKR